jgi:hypothetical protein
MAVFAELELNTNKVLRVINIPRLAARNDGAEYINNILGLSGTWIRSASASQFMQIPGLPKNWAQPGHTYNAKLNAFITPQPYPSWVLNVTTCNWKPPVPPPVITGEEKYTWSEQNKQWVLIDPHQTKITGIRIFKSPANK